MTYRERRERKAARLREWAEKRHQRAQAVFQQGECYRGDVAFNTQPGHIPERARVIAREHRAHESLQKADSMTQRASGIEDQLERSIYSDDADAIDRLQERIAGLEAERERMKRANKDFRAGRKLDELEYLTENDRRVLLEVAKFQPYYCKDGLRFPPYALQNLSTNIARYRKRLDAARPPTEASASPGTPGDGHDA